MNAAKKKNLAVDNYIKFAWFKPLVGISVML